MRGDDEQSGAERDSGPGRPAESPPAATVAVTSGFPSKFAVHSLHTLFSSQATHRARPPPLAAGEGLGAGSPL